jgi:hypothetical protein
MDQKWLPTSEDEQDALEIEVPPEAQKKKEEVTAECCLGRAGFCNNVGIAKGLPRIPCGCCGYCTPGDNK